MVRQNIILMIFIVILSPSMLHAQEICGPQEYSGNDQPNFDCPSPGENEMVPDLQPPDSIPVTASVSVRALWDGALVHRDRLIELGMRIRALRRLRWADNLRIAAEYSIRLDHIQEVGRVQLENMTAQRDVYEERWRAAEERALQTDKWWRSPALWFGVGIVIASCLFALSAYGLSAVSD